jgi:hypothetical protein
MRDRTGWQSFAEWALALALLSFAIIAAASIGMFVFPFAIVALVFAERRNRSWPEPLMGGLVGIGSVLLFVAYRNRHYAPCPPGRFPMRLAHGEHFSCGGFDPMPWLAVGALLTAAGLVSYLVSMRRGERATRAVW